MTTKAITSVSSLIALVAIFFTENVRIPIGLRIEELAADIAMNGLKKPIEVANRGKKFEIIAGHRREAAIQWVKENDPEAYQKHFAKGVPCIVWDGLSDNEIMIKKVDHGNELALNNPFEAYRCTKLLVNAGSTEVVVVATLSGLYDRLHRPTGKFVKLVEGLYEKLTNAANDKARAEVQKTIDEEKHAYRKGFLQGYKDVIYSPSQVERAYYFKLVGVKAVGYEDEALPERITGKQIKALKKAHLADMEAATAKGGKRPTRDLPGKLFNTAWAELLKAEADKAANPSDPRAKAMSSKDMEGELNSGKFSSELAQQLTQHHMGDKEVNGADLLKLDRIAYLVDVVLEHGNGEMDDVIQQGENLIKAIQKVEQDKAQAEAAKDAAKEPEAVTAAA